MPLPDRRTQAALFRRRYNNALGGGGVTVALKSTNVDGFTGWTTARAGSALYFDVTRTIQTASSGTTRNGAAGAAHYLDANDGQFAHWLLEPARTNSALNNRDLTQASWTKTLCTIGGSTTLADGTTGTTNGIIANAGVVAALVVNAAAYTWTLSTAQAIYFVVKAGNKSQFFISTTDKALAVASSWVNSSTGVVGTTAGTHVIKTWQLTSSNWLVQLRLTTSGTPATGGQLVAFGPADADNSLTVTGDGSTVNCYVDYCGMENDQGSPSSPIVTGASAVARVADTTPTRAHNSVPQSRTLYSDETALALFSSLNGSFTIGGYSGGSNYQAIDGTLAMRGLVVNNAVGSTPSAGGAAAVAGQRVEKRCASNPDTSPTAGQSNNTGAESSANGAATAAYQANYTTVNYQVAAPNSVLQSTALRAVKDVLGVQPMATMRGA